MELCFSFLYATLFLLKDSITLTVPLSISAKKSAVFDILYPSLCIKLAIGPCPFGGWYTGGTKK